MVMYRRHSSKDNFLTDKGIGWIDSGSTFRLNVEASLSRVFLLSTDDSSHSHTAIFVNGCFWHGHPGCGKFRLPHSNVEFWAEKIRRNKERDAAETAALEALGWNVIVVLMMLLHLRQLM